METDPASTFIARQPIFNRRLEVYGYELLFRAGPENFFANKDDDAATSSVIEESVTGFGLDEISDGRPVFINLSRQTLIERLIKVLPRERVVVEILESVEPDPEVMDACRDLKDAGYRIALDDFARLDYVDLIDLADIIKVDFVATSSDTRRAMTKAFPRKRIEFVAEKVENHEELKEAMDAGYNYFQGYFFCKPEMMSRRTIPVIKQNYLRFLHEVTRPDLEHTHLEPIIREDVSLTVKLLRFLNSAYFGLRTEIKSIKHALLLLGRDSVRQWATLVAMSGLADDKPSELLTLSLMRARFCETFGKAIQVSQSSDDMFLMGMLSTVDALTDRPMAEILADIPISAEVKGALMGDKSTLSGLLAIAVAGERGEWEKLTALCADLKIDEAQIPSLYREAIVWASRVPRP